MSDNVRFSKLLENHLLGKVQQFTHRQFTKTLLHEIHLTVVNSLHEIFDKSVNYKLTKPSIDWLGMQYFNALKVSDDVHIRDLVLFNEIQLSELPFVDVRLMNDLFDETVIGPMLSAELKRRMTS